jgi:hypothetical protein
MSHQFFAISRDGSVPITAPFCGVRLLPRFGTPNDGLSDAGTIDIKAVRLRVYALAMSVPSTRKCHSKRLQKVPNSARKCHSFMMSRTERHGWETFPKTAIYCHLLAFWSRKTAKSVLTVSIRFLPFEGVPASRGPGLRTASGGQEELRWGVAIASSLCTQMRRTKPFVRNQSVSGLATESPLR